MDLQAGSTLGIVAAVHCDLEHRFSKRAVPGIELVAGHGVRGDAHFGLTVQHQSRVARDPTQPNLRQVHLLHEELLSELARAGHRVEPGRLGENITTRGLGLLDLPADALLGLGADAVVRVTGLRNPCAQIESFQAGLLQKVLARAADGSLIRKAGVMGVVEQGGIVRAGDPIRLIQLPAASQPLRPV